MITAERIAYSIRHVVKKLNIQTDDLNDNFLYSRNPAVAEFMMQMEFKNTRTIPDTWIMNLGKVNTVNVNSGDDPNIGNGSIVLASFEMPRLASFNGKPFFQAYNGLRTEHYTVFDSFDVFMMAYNSDRKVLEKYPSCILMNGKLYIYPDKGLQLRIVAANPLDCFVKRALNNPETGLKMYDATELRKMTIYDEYPITESLVYGLTLEILEKDYGISRNVAIDNLQDGNDSTQQQQR